MSVDTTKSARVTIKVPANFDPDRHSEKILEKVTAKYGEGFRLQSYDPADGEVTLVREGTVTLFNAQGDVLHVELPDGTSESEGTKLSAEYESLKPGWKVVDFQPYAKPGFATMRQMSDAEIRVRDALAQVFSLQRQVWNVQVKEKDSGGFDIKLPKSYSPARHDGKLLEVAETAAGEPGWWVKVDPKTLIGKILPGELPTFPAMIPFDFTRTVPRFTKATNTEWVKVPIGRALGKPGEVVGPEFCFDLKAAGHTLLQGTPGSGKSVNINAYIWYLLKVGAKVAIIDTPEKSADFMWAKPYVMDGGWGCESYEEMVATTHLVYSEGKRRAKILKSKGIANWFDIDDDPSFVPIILIVDEYTGLMAKRNELKSLDRSHPKRVEAIAINQYKDMLDDNVHGNILEMRFAGIFVLISTQVGNTKTGVSTAIKNGCGNRVLMGARASDNQRRNAFSDPDSVPTVPDNVRSNKQVSRGVGCGEFDGQAPTIFKGYFATPNEFAANLAGDPHVRRTSRPTPTREEINEAIGVDDLDDEGSDEAMDEQMHGGQGFTSSTSEGMNIARDMGLRGAAAANFASNYDLKKAQKMRCESCGALYDDGGHCQCSK